MERNQKDMLWIAWREDEEDVDECEGNECEGENCKDEKERKKKKRIEYEAEREENGIEERIIASIW